MNILTEQHEYLEELSNKEVRTERYSYSARPHRTNNRKRTKGRTVQYVRCITNTFPPKLYWKEIKHLGK